MKSIEPSWNQAIHICCTHVSLTLFNVDITSEAVSNKKGISSISFLFLFVFHYSECSIKDGFLRGTESLAGKSFLLLWFFFPFCFLSSSIKSQFKFNFHINP